MKNIKVTRTVVLICCLLLLPQTLVFAGENLIKNSGFESDLTGWQDSGSYARKVTIKTTDCYSGKCVELVAPNNSSCTLYQNITSLTPQQDYFFSAMFKAPAGFSGYAVITDLDWHNSTGGIPNGGGGGRAIQVFAMPGESGWKKITGGFQVPIEDDFRNSTALHRWQVQLRAFYPPSNPVVSYDEISLSVLESRYLPAYGCSNSLNSKCLNLGSSDEIGNGIILNTNLSDNKILSDKKIDGTVDYRVLQPQRLLEIRFPAFNISSGSSLGLPASPMLLEIRYKDTINSNGLDLRSGTLTYKRASVYSRINFYDPKAAYRNAGGQMIDYKIAGLGELGDGQWKYIQYAFQNNNFSLIRAINNYFTISIQMPTAPEDKELQVPIDYISLRAITQEEYQRFLEKQKELHSFYRVPEPIDEPQVPATYANSNLVVFARDIMHPVYKHTKPQPQEEQNLLIKGFTALGEVEPLSFAIYSQNGINNLTFQITDLTKAGGNSIPASNVTVKHVAYHDVPSLPNGYNKGYALLPDRLEDIMTLSIAAGTSERIWLKVNVPESEISGGIYNGRVIIKQNGTTLRTVRIQLDVLPIRLDFSEHLNIIYGDPHSQAFSNNQEAVFQLYRETGVAPFMGLGTGDLIIILKDPKLPVSSTNPIVDFDATVFTQRFDELRIKGNVKRAMFIETVWLWQPIYSKIYGRSPYKDNLLYERLGNEDFINAFQLAIQKMVAIASLHKITLYFSVDDEPGVDPFKRIAADRLYMHIRGAGAKTTVTYYRDCDKELTNLSTYTVTGGKIPPLTNLIDYKIWTPSHIADGYKRHNLLDTSYPAYSGDFGYYTTYFANVRSPLYNRLLNGLFAYRTGAKAVSVYAFGTWINDPYNDFDPGATHIFPYTATDYFLAYPSWDGKLLPTLALEGLRMGIEDAKYIATVKRLSQGGSSQVAIDAQNYLQKLKGLGDYDFWFKIVTLNKSLPFGAEKEMLKNFSESEFGKETDWETFTRKRMTLHNCLKSLLGLSSFVYGDVNADGQVRAYDAALATQISQNLVNTNIKSRLAADVDKEKGVTINDSNLISQKATGLRDQLPIEE